jgi:cbb3-type cytochrome oxidase subunit 3
MDVLQAKYTTQLAEYDALTAQAIQSDDVTAIPQIRAKNVQIAATLNEMITSLTFLKQNTTSTVKQERDALIQKLVQIQNDYNSLNKSKDTLETLRRIRQQVNYDAQSQLRLYLLFFLLFALCIVFYVMFMAQKKDTTAASARTPPMMAALV